jgi:hypothetical protein
MFDPNDYLAIIAAYPNGHCHPNLINWFRDIELTANQIITHYNFKRDLISEYNWGIREVALKSKYNMFIFADNDIQPKTRTTHPFLELDTDICCCVYPTELPCHKSWGLPTAFHSGLWRTNREVLERMDRPWFRYEPIEDGTAFRACVCESFGVRALAEGFTISHGGWAHHVPQRLSR